MVIAHPLALALLLLVPLPWLLLRRKGYVGHSNVKLLGAMGGQMHIVPVALLTLGLVALIVALSGPQRVRQISTTTMKARDIIVAVDISGSMGGGFTGELPRRTQLPAEVEKDLPERPPKKNADGTKPPQRRIDAAQAAVLNFVRDRYAAKAGDRVGVVTFDSSPYYAWPLTHDLKMIYRKIQFADVGLGGGTNFGERKPGPIDLAAEHLDELGQSVTKVLILVTDGEDNLSGSAMERLTEIIKTRGIRLYVIGVGETLARKDVDILRLAASVGGQGFRVETPADLDNCFRSIDAMERSSVQVETTQKRDELFFYFAGAALLLLVFGIVGEALVLNQ